MQGITSYEHYSALHQTVRLITYCERLIASGEARADGGVFQGIQERIALLEKEGFTLESAREALASNKAQHDKIREAYLEENKRHGQTYLRAAWAGAMRSREALDAIVEQAASPADYPWE